MTNDGVLTSVGTGARQGVETEGVEVRVETPAETRPDHNAICRCKDE